MSDKLFDVLADVLEVPVSEINESFNFVEHENWDSLTSLTLMATLEDEYGILLPESAIKNVGTVAGLRSLLQS